MLKRYAADVSRTTAVVLGVLSLLAAVVLIAVGVSVLLQHGHAGRSPVVTVTIAR
jgi:hypothetical protein